jgi:hypothetical protein
LIQHLLAAGVGQGQGEGPGGGERLAWGGQRVPAGSRCRAVAEPGSGLTRWAGLTGGCDKPLNMAARAGRVMVMQQAEGGGGRGSPFPGLWQRCGRLGWRAGPRGGRPRLQLACCVPHRQTHVSHGSGCLHGMLQQAGHVRLPLLAAGWVGRGGGGNRCQGHHANEHRPGMHPRRAGRDLQSQRQAATWFVTLPEEAAGRAADERWFRCGERPCCLAICAPAPGLHHAYAPG